MRNYNEQNERIKHEYVTYLTHVRGKASSTIDKALASLNAYERSIQWQDFGKFNDEWPINFKEELELACHPKTGKPLAASTIVGKLTDVKAFHLWLADKDGYRSSIRHSHAQLFNPSNRQVRIARDARPKTFPSLQQIQHLLHNMPGETVIQRRNRAIVALLILTGMRVAALIDLRVKHVNLIDRTVSHDAREMHTKFSKSNEIWFFTVCAFAEQCLSEYVTELRDDRLFSPEDPLFPATQIGKSDNGPFQGIGLSRKAWRSTSSVRKIVQEAFRSVGLPGYGPHRFRDTLSQIGQERCKTPEQLIAWSQNLDHEDVLTTLRSYGKMDIRRRGEVLGSIQGRRE